MKKRTIILALLAFNLQAQNNPTPYSTDTRIKHVMFQDNNVVPIRGVTFTTTQIQFGDNERVLDIEGGDSTAWMVTYHPELTNMVFVKPTILDSSTNMTVITNHHAYYFHLTSNKTLEKESSQQTYALKFVYPTVTSHSKSSAKALADATPPQPKMLNTAYRFSGSPQ